MSTSSSDQEQSEPTEVPDILSMSQEQIDAMVSDLQEKRMLTRRRYEEAQLAKKRVRDEQARAQMETCLMRMKKCVDAIDKKIEAFEKDYKRLDTLKRIAMMEGEYETNEGS